jgi:hypothetical protein
MTVDKEWIKMVAKIKNDSRLPQAMKERLIDPLKFYDFQLECYRDYMCEHQRFFVYGCNELPPKCYVSFYDTFKLKPVELPTLHFKH